MRDVRQFENTGPMKKLQILRVPAKPKLKLAEWPNKCWNLRESEYE